MNLPQCVILAGGLGTRMRHLSGDKPKALVPVNGVPFAGHQLTWLAHQGIQEVVYSIGFRGESIQAYVGDGSAWDLRVTYLDDGPRLLGTGGALRRGIGLGLIRSPFLVLYGDAFLPIDYAPVVTAFERSGQPALMTVFRNADAWSPSNAVFVDGQIVLYDKRPEAKLPDMTYIDYGLSIFSHEALMTAVSDGEVSDLSDLCHALSLKGRLAGYEVRQRFYEVGSPEGLTALEGYLSSTNG